MANTRHIEGERRLELSPGDVGYDALDDLWGRLARPFEAASTIGALIGISPKDLDRQVGLTVANSPEAEHLLDEFPRTVRSLATSMKTHAERCVGELRGPVLWSETMSARASTFGANDVYVCATPSRAYDIDENQVLKWALVKLNLAAESALEGVSSHSEELVYRKVRRAGNDAGRFSEHPSMARVSIRRPNLRTLKRTRSGKKSHAYLPAIAFIRKLSEPIDAAFVRRLRDPHTIRQHELLMTIVHLLEDHTENHLPEFRIEQGALYAGPVQYHNHHRLADGKVQSGVVVGQLLVDVPPEGMTFEDAEREMAARAGSRHHRLVRTPGDIERAVNHAIELATSD